MRGQKRDQRNRSLQVFVIALVAVVAIGLVALNLPRRSAASRADPSEARLVAQGQQVYRARCASCHGANLEGQPNWQQELPGGGRPAPPHDASGHTWHHPDALLFDITKRGSQASLPDAALGIHRIAELEHTRLYAQHSRALASRWLANARSHYEPLTVSVPTMPASLWPATVQ